MSAPTATPVGASTRALQLGVLLALYGLMLALPALHLRLDGMAGVIVAIGFLLLSGMLASELVGLVGLPHLTGYIAAGVIAGPHVAHIIDHSAVQQLSVVNTLALSLIALAGGLELRLDDLKQGGRSIAWAMVTQSVGLLVIGAGLLFVLRPYVDFAAGMATTTWLAACLLWGVLAVSRSPSVTLAIISQLKPKGPLTRFSLGFVMTSDVVVVVMMATIMSLARPWMEPGSEFSLSSLYTVGREIIGSISIGITLGLLLVAYLRLVGGQILLLILVLSFVVSEAIHYLHFEPILAFLCAGFVVQNLSQQGPKLLHSIEETGSLVFVVFFGTAGAHLDVPLLTTLWPVALVLCLGRVGGTWAMHRLGSRLAKDGPQVRVWGWAPLVSQAGLTLGLSAMIARQFPTFGEGLRALVITTVAMNEIIGPILFKFALQRTGEIPPAG